MYTKKKPIDLKYLRTPVRAPDYKNYPDLPKQKQNQEHATSKTTVFSTFSEVLLILPVHKNQKTAGHKLPNLQSRFIGATAPPGL